MLTVKMLEDMPPGTIFGRGTFRDSPAEVNFMGTGKFLRWIAKRGGTADWAIYVGHETANWVDVEQDGDKMHMDRSIRKLVQCDDDALARYRR